MVEPRIDGHVGGVDSGAPAHGQNGVGAAEEHRTHLYRHLDDQAIPPECAFRHPVIHADPSHSTLERVALPGPADFSVENVLGESEPTIVTNWYIRKVVREEVRRQISADSWPLIESLLSGETNLEFYYEIDDNRYTRLVVMKKDQYNNVSFVADYKINGRATLDQCGGFSAEIFYLQKLLEGCGYLNIGDYIPGELDDETVQALYAYMTSSKHLMTEDPQELIDVVMDKAVRMYEVSGFASGIIDRGGEVDIRLMRYMPEAVRSVTDLYEYSNRILKMLPGESDDPSVERLRELCRWLGSEAENKLYVMASWYVMGPQKDDGTPDRSRSLFVREKESLRKRWERYQKRSNKDTREAISEYETCLSKYRQLFDQLQEYRALFSWDDELTYYTDRCLLDLNTDLEAVADELGLTDWDPHSQEKINLLFEYIDDIVAVSERDKLEDLNEKYKRAKALLELNIDGPTKTRALSAFYAYLDESSDKDLAKILPVLNYLLAYGSSYEVMALVQQLYANDKAVQESGKSASQFANDNPEFQEAYRDIYYEVDSYSIELGISDIDQMTSDVVDLAYMLYSSYQTYDRLLPSYRRYQTDRQNVDGNLEDPLAAGIKIGLPNRGRVTFDGMLRAVGEIADLMRGCDLPNKDQRELIGLVMGLPEVTAADRDSAERSRAEIELARSYEMELTQLAFALEDAEGNPYIDGGEEFVRSAQVISINPRFISFMERDYREHRVFHHLYTMETLLATAPLIEHEKFVDTSFLPTMVDWSVATERSLRSDPKCILIAYLRALRDMNASVEFERDRPAVVVDDQFVEAVEIYLTGGNGRGGIEVITEKQKCDLVEIIRYGIINEDAVKLAARNLGKVERELIVDGGYDYTEFYADLFVLTNAGSVFLVDDEAMQNGYAESLIYRPPAGSGTIYERDASSFLKHSKIGTILLAMYGHTPYVSGQHDISRGRVHCRLDAGDLHSAVRVFGEGRYYLRFGPPVLTIEETTALEDFIAQANLLVANGTLQEGDEDILLRLMSYGAGAKFTAAEMARANRIFTVVLEDETQFFYGKPLRQQALASARNKYIEHLGYVARKEGLNEEDQAAITALADILNKYGLEITDHTLTEEVPEEFREVIRASEQSEWARNRDVAILNSVYPHAMRVLKLIHRQLRVLADKYPVEEEKDLSTFGKAAYEIVHTYYHNLGHGIQEAAKPPEILEFTIVGMGELDMMRFNFWLYEDYVREADTAIQEKKQLEAQIETIIGSKEDPEIDTINWLLSQVDIEYLRGLQAALKKEIRKHGSESKTKPILQQYLQTVTALIEMYENGLENPLQLLSSLDYLVEELVELEQSLTQRKKGLKGIKVGEISGSALYSAEGTRLTVAMDRFVTVTLQRMRTLQAKRKQVYDLQNEILQKDYIIATRKSRLMSDVFDQESFARLRDKLPRLREDRNFIDAAAEEWTAFYSSLLGVELVVHDANGRVCERTAEEILTDYFENGGQVSMSALSSSLIAPGENEEVTLAKMALAKILEQIPRNVNVNLLTALPTLIFGGRHGCLEGFFNVGRDGAALVSNIIGFPEVSVGPDNLERLDRFFSNPFYYTIYSMYYSTGSWAGMVTNMYQQQNMATSFHSIMIGAPTGQDYLDRKIVADQSRDYGDYSSLDVIDANDVNDFIEYFSSELIEMMGSPYIRERIEHLQAINKLRTDIGRLAELDGEARDAFLRDFVAQLAALAVFLKQNDLAVPLWDQFSGDMHEGKARQVREELVFLAAVVEDLFVIVGEKNKAAGIYSSEDMNVTYFNPLDSLRIASGADEMPKRVEEVRYDTKSNDDENGLAYTAHAISPYAPLINGYTGDRVEGFWDVAEYTLNDMYEVFADTDGFWEDIGDILQIEGKILEGYVKGYVQFTVLMGRQIKAGFVDMWDGVDLVLAGMTTGSGDKIYEGLRRFFEGMGHTAGAFTTYETLGFIFVDVVFEDFKQGRWEEGLGKLFSIMDMITHGLAGTYRLLRHAAHRGAVRFRNGALEIDSAFLRRRGTPVVRDFLGLSPVESLLTRLGLRPAGEAHNRVFDGAVTRRHRGEQVFPDRINRAWRTLVGGEHIVRTGAIAGVEGGRAPRTGLGIRLAYYTTPLGLLEAPRAYRATADFANSAGNFLGMGWGEDRGNLSSLRDPLSLEFRPVQSQGTQIGEVESRAGLARRGWNVVLSGGDLVDRGLALAGHGYDAGMEYGWRRIRDGAADVVRSPRGRQGSTPAVAGQIEALRAQITRVRPDLAPRISPDATVSELLVLRAELLPQEEVAISVRRGDVDAVGRNIDRLATRIADLESQISTRREVTTDDEAGRRRGIRDLEREKQGLETELQRELRRYQRLTGNEYFKLNPTAEPLQTYVDGIDSRLDRIAELNRQVAVEVERANPELVSLRQQLERGRAELSRTLQERQRAGIPPEQISDELGAEFMRLSQLQMEYNLAMADAFENDAATRRACAPIQERIAETQAEIRTLESEYAIRTHKNVYMEGGNPELAHKAMQAGLEVGGMFSQFERQRTFVLSNETFMELVEMVRSGNRQGFADRIRQHNARNPHNAYTGGTIAELWETFQEFRNVNRFSQSELGDTPNERRFSLETELAEMRNRSTREAAFNRRWQFVVVQGENYSTIELTGRQICRLFGQGTPNARGKGKVVFQQYQQMQARSQELQRLLSTDTSNMPAWRRTWFRLMRPKWRMQQAWNWLKMVKFEFRCRWRTGMSSGNAMAIYNIVRPREVGQMHVAELGRDARRVYRSARQPRHSVRQTTRPGGPGPQGGPAAPGSRTPAGQARPQAPEARPVTGTVDPTTPFKQDAPETDRLARAVSENKGDYVRVEAGVEGRHLAEIESKMRGNAARLPIEGWQEFYRQRGGSERVGLMYRVRTEGGRVYVQPAVYIESNGVYILMDVHSTGDGTTRLSLRPTNVQADSPEALANKAWGEMRTPRSTPTGSGRGPGTAGSPGGGTTTAAGGLTTSDPGGKSGGTTAHSGVRIGDSVAETGPRGEARPGVVLVEEGSALAMAEVTPDEVRRSAEVIEIEELRGNRRATSETARRISGNRSAVADASSDSGRSMRAAGRMLQQLMRVGAQQLVIEDGITLTSDLMKEVTHKAQHVHMIRQERGAVGAVVVVMEAGEVRVVALEASVGTVEVRNGEFVVRNGENTRPLSDFVGKQKSTGASAHGVVVDQVGPRLTLISDGEAFVGDTAFEDHDARQAEKAAEERARTRKGQGNGRSGVIEADFQSRRGGALTIDLSSSQHGALVEAVEAIYRALDPKASYPAPETLRNGSEGARQARRGFSVSDSTPTERRAYAEYLARELRASGITRLMVGEGVWLTPPTGTQSESGSSLQAIRESQRAHGLVGENCEVVLVGEIDGVEVQVESTSRVAETRAMSQTPADFRAKHSHPLYQALLIDIDAREALALRRLERKSRMSEQKRAKRAARIQESYQRERLELVNNWDDIRQVYELQREVVGLQQQLAELGRFGAFTEEGTRIRRELDLKAAQATELQNKMLRKKSIVRYGRRTITAHLPMLMAFLTMDVARGIRHDEDAEIIALHCAETTALLPIFSMTENQFITRFGMTRLSAMTSAGGITGGAMAAVHEIPHLRSGLGGNKYHLRAAQMRIIQGFAYGSASAYAMGLVPILFSNPAGWTIVLVTGLSIGVGMGTGFLLYYAGDKLGLEEFIGRDVDRGDIVAAFEELGIFAKFGGGGDARTSEFFTAQDGALVSGAQDTVLFLESVGEAKTEAARAKRHEIVELGIRQLTFDSSASASVEVLDKVFAEVAAYQAEHPRCERVDVHVVYDDTRYYHGARGGRIGSTQEYRVVITGLEPTFMEEPDELTGESGYARVATEQVRIYSHYQGNRGEIDELRTLWENRENVGLLELSLMPQASILLINGSEGRDELAMNDLFNYPTLTAELVSALQAAGSDIEDGASAKVIKRELRAYLRDFGVVGSGEEVNATVAMTLLTGWVGTMAEEDVEGGAEGPTALEQVGLIGADGPRGEVDAMFTQLIQLSSLAGQSAPVFVVNENSYSHEVVAIQRGLYHLGLIADSDLITGEINAETQSAIDQFVAQYSNLYLPVSMHPSRCGLVNGKFYFTQADGNVQISKTLLLSIAITLGFKEQIDAGEMLTWHGDEAQNVLNRHIVGKQNVFYAWAAEKAEALQTQPELAGYHYVGFSYVGTTAVGLRFFNASGEEKVVHARYDFDTFLPPPEGEEELEPEPEPSVPLSNPAFGGYVVPPGLGRQYQ